MPSTKLFECILFGITIFVDTYIRYIKWILFLIAVQNVKFLPISGLFVDYYTNIIDKQHK